MSHRSVSPRQFGDYTLEYQQRDEGERRPRHAIIAMHSDWGSTPVGEMQWHGTSHRVLGIEVDEEHQRKGLGTAMWKMGQEMRPRPKHSNQRTDAGDAWARKVGGPLPRRTHVDR